MHIPSHKHPKPFKSSVKSGAIISISQNGGPSRWSEITKWCSQQAPEIGLKSKFFWLLRLHSFPQTLFLPPNKYARPVFEHRGRLEELQAHLIYCAWLYWFSQMLCLLQIEGKTLPLQKDYDWLYCDPRFIAVAWNWTARSPVVCLY